MTVRAVAVVFAAALVLGFALLGSAGILAHSIEPPPEKSALPWTIVSSTITLDPAVGAPVLHLEYIGPDYRRVTWSALGFTFVRACWDQAVVGRPLPECMMGSLFADFRFGVPTTTPSPR